MTIDIESSAASAPVVDVIVPAYRGLAETRRCLESVLAFPQQTAYELVVIDDCSPEPELSTWLRDLAETGAITLLINPVNTGFVNAVNRGMVLHPDRDVMLLNSDTEVHGDWLDRLRRCAESGAMIGTVTPFSNNATICSYPRFNHDNPLPEDWPLAKLDALFAE
ncbi:MAG: glycosyltransferase, partial [Chloroflexota bacterium]